MLTKKQIWRRTKSVQRNYHRHNETTTHENELTAVHKTSQQPYPLHQPPIKLKSALSSGNLTKLKNSHPRFLRFSSTEILSQCINVYYLTEDYVLFKKEAIQEIREIAKQYNLTVKMAMSYLYQPNFVLPRTESLLSLLDHLSTSSPTSSSISSPLSSSPSSPTSTHEDSPTQGRPQQIGRSQGEGQSQGGGGPQGRVKQGMNHSEFVKTSKFLESELKFFVNVKTDVELQDQNTNRGVVKRPAGASTPSLKQHAWVVQWKKQQSHAPAGNAPTTTSSLAVGSFHSPSPAYTQ